MSNVRQFQMNETELDEIIQLAKLREEELRNQRFDRLERKKVPPSWIVGKINKFWIRLGERLGFEPWKVKDATSDGKIRVEE